MPEDLIGSPLHVVVVQLKNTLQRAAEVAVSELADDNELLRMFTRKELVDKTVREEVYRILMERFDVSLPSEYDAEKLARTLVDMVCSTRYLN